MSRTGPWQHVKLRVPRGNVLTWPDSLSFFLVLSLESQLSTNHEWILGSELCSDTACDLPIKVDAYHRISTETVYDLSRKIEGAELDRLYPGRRMFFGRSGNHVKQNVDIFELPQLAAWAAVLSYLDTTSGDVHPNIVFEDINKITYDIHVGGMLHGHIMENIGDYLEPNPRLEGMLKMMRDTGKQTFVLTNSPYKFIDVGMSQIIGSHWMELFDIVICLSKKPHFFNDTKRPFRRVSSNNEPTFGQVNQLVKGEVYCEGNVRDLHKFTGWNPCRILYFGDQMLADLAEPVLNQGWHTGAIIRELNEELELLNSAECQHKMFLMNELNFLINDVQQFIPHPTAIRYLGEWCIERKKVRRELLDLHPTKFGSIFRTHLTPTLFYRRLSRFAEIYTSDLTNLTNFSPEHHRFTPTRQYLPHEMHCQSQLDICRAKCSWKQAKPWTECSKSVKY
eukprot:sb/3464618/